MPRPARTGGVGAPDRFQKLPYGERPASGLSTELTRIPGRKRFTPEGHPDVLAQAGNDLVS